MQGADLVSKSSYQASCVIYLFIFRHPAPQQLNKDLFFKFRNTIWLVWGNGCNINHAIVKNLTFLRKSFQYRVSNITLLGEIAISRR